MNKFKKIFTSIIFITIFTNSFLFGEGRTNLSWIGFLKLPKKHSHDHQILKGTKDPDIWSKWKDEKKAALDWLPKNNKRKKSQINTQLITPLVHKEKTNKKRRHKDK
jgi:hypothetical protein